MGSGLGVARPPPGRAATPRRQPRRRGRDRQLRGHQHAAGLAAPRRVPDDGGRRGSAAPMLGLVLVPGLLAAGIGLLIFLGLDSLTGLGTFSLAIPNAAAVRRPDGADFGWAIVFGLVAPFLGRGIRWLALTAAARTSSGGCCCSSRCSGWSSPGWRSASARRPTSRHSDVLFSGQSALGPLVEHARNTRRARCCCSSLCKGLAYGCRSPASAAARSSRRCSSAPPAGSPLPPPRARRSSPRSAMGIGAMCTVMLTLPLTSDAPGHAAAGLRRRDVDAARDRRGRRRLRRHRAADAAPRAGRGYASRRPSRRAWATASERHDTSNFR